MGSSRHHRLAVVLSLTVALAGCGSAATPGAAVDTLTAESGTAEPTAAESTGAESAVQDQAARAVIDRERFPVVVDATASIADGLTWNVAVTLSSPYDSPERYADAWRVLDVDDNELGIRVLGHDHANEQPFTRSGRITIPADTDRVFIEGRDQANGWSGERYALTLSP